LGADQEFAALLRNVTDARLHHEAVACDIKPLLLDLKCEVDLITNFEFRVGFETQSTDGNVDRLRRDALAAFWADFEMAPKRKTLVITPV
jgi:hypothetical protein